MEYGVYGIFLILGNSLFYLLEGTVAVGCGSRFYGCKARFSGVGFRRSSGQGVGDFRSVE